MMMRQPDNPTHIHTHTPPIPNICISPRGSQHSAPLHLYSLYILITQGYRLAMTIQKPSKPISYAENIVTWYTIVDQFVDYAPNNIIEAWT